MNDFNTLKVRPASYEMLAWQLPPLCAATPKRSILLCWLDRVGVVVRAGDYLRESTGTPGWPLRDWCSPICQVVAFTWVVATVVLQWRAIEIGASEFIVV